MLLDGGANVNESNHDTKSNLFECFNPKFMKLVLEYHPILFFDAPKFYILNRRLDVAKELIRYYPKEDHYLIYNAAISLCSYDMVKYLIDHNFDFDSRSIDGMTPIFDAIRFNQIDIPKLLINSGANLENTDINGETAILYATSFLSRGKFGNNHLNMPNINNMNDLIKFLIDCDANINTENKSHNNLLQNSIVNGNILLYNKLKYLGIKTQLINNESLDSLRKKIKVTGETLFTYIVKNDNIIFLELYNSIIVEEKKIPDINVQNVSGETPIMCVIKYNKNPAYLTLLIRGGADADQEYQGKTPLQICIENEYTDKIRAFLQNECCDLNKKFDNRMSYFHLAIKMNKKLSMRALASYVFPDFVDKDGNSYLHYAALSNDREITYICLHVQEKYIVYNNENMSPLMLASSINSFRYIDQFIDFCDKHWIPIKDKYRSLFLAVMNRSFDSYYSILKIILCSVDPNSENTK
ncbi:hypothetical protein TVAG_015610 [Trichomonas vaginalis G3]|uniref:Uncharacterized protein n=2 Tax=Trichomonas vaginalis (strain ATCC PRA-98 / G3) TaxID=412133 RepID=A2F6W1_TRIV3|nr:spectrin binding [Trichomonas vaginalis G3]EAX99378.1 hypothetical protein TVAG_015610 [Trichomonas vaginalis G3]KAI5511328.1 spectrin binding [Trichomonas vaginalis G3]|eukprot:XP_001312308.1 hypothetical protein [Trichomonas vaginalis G3]